jgi:hypothetical protein
LRPTAIELAFKTAAEMVLFDSYQGYTGDLRDLHTFEAFDEAVKNRLPISARRRLARSLASAYTVT